MHNQLFNTLNITLTTEWVSVLLILILLVDPLVVSPVPMHTQFR